jgi:hypothetical protein
MELTARNIRQLSQIALTLEPLLDKEDCTTRYVDLDGKPLVDFVIAGVNVGSVIEDFAQEALTGNIRMFRCFKDAILASNDYKSPKLINTGLLHVLFITICVRLQSKNLEEAIASYITVMQHTTNQDARDFVEGLEASWKSSNRKAAWIDERKKVLPSIKSYYELQQTIFAGSADSTSSSYQVTRQATEGFPIIAQFIKEINESKGLIKSLETTYHKIHKDNPELKIGFLADLSASALFLYLSFQDPKQYQIS